MSAGKSGVGGSASGDTLKRVAAMLLDGEGRFVSGEELGKALGVSRPAISRHVASLRRLGYELESVPNRGHRVLSRPDLLLPWEVAEGLETERLGRSVQHFMMVESTQDIARELAETGLPEGTLVVAEQQRMGRGRMGRGYFSPIGGIWCSLILRPKLAPTQVQLLALGAGLAVAAAVEDVCQVRPTLKWPNDLLLRERKVCGLLIEMTAEHDLVHHLVLGIGLNVNVSTELFPEELRSTATSLSIETGREVSRRQLLQRILYRLELRYSQLARGRSQELINSWKAWPNCLSRKVRVVGLAEQWEGVAEDLGADGALLVRRQDGTLRRAVAGDVHLLAA